MHTLIHFFQHRLKQLISPSPKNAACAWQKLGNSPESFYWLFATPVHLMLARDSFILADPHTIKLSNDEATQLTISLNQHFSQEGLQFYWQQNQWFLRLAHDPHIETIAPKHAINRKIDDFQTTGSGAIVWAKLQNEIQMLLFSHPINHHREKNKQLTINSIWCHGGGKIS